MKEIHFLPKNLDAELLVDCPTPARKNIPDWFAKLPAFRSPDNKFEMDAEGKTNTTAKLCMPLVDAFGMGYIQRTWTDIMIDIDSKGEVSYSFPGGPPIVNHREEPSYKMPSGFYPVEFLWQNQWIPKVPKGYSVLYTHPLNRNDLPFQTHSGVVDSDKYYYESAGNHPFFIKEGFTGIIPQGTPMFQIIPFKRDDWKSVALPTQDTHEKLSMKTRQKFWGVYKDRFWTKKTFI